MAAKKEKVMIGFIDQWHVVYFCIDVAVWELHSEVVSISVS